MAPPLASGNVRLSVKERVATIVLDRDEALNALTRAMREDLSTALRWCAERKDEVRCVILAGDGRSFCAGQDLKEGGDHATPVESLAGKLAGDFQTELAQQPQPTVAALHGHVLGRGLEVALTCDIRIAAEDTSIALPEVGIGMIPASGGTQRLPRLIGAGRALHLLLTGERIDARTAYEWGIVTRVVPRDELESAAQELGQRLAEQAPLALLYSRRAVLEGTHLSLAEGLHLEAALAAVLRTTEDRQEGPRAFREKRRPRFTGR